MQWLIVEVTHDFRYVIGYHELGSYNVCVKWIDILSVESANTTYEFIYRAFDSESLIINTDILIKRRYI